LILKITSLLTTKHGNPILSNIQKQPSANIQRIPWLSWKVSIPVFALKEEAAKSKKPFKIP
jgi:hypothetical protein